MTLVVKVGGSLFDHPLLFPGLRSWLAHRSERILLVAGGGDAAEAVRAWDRIHQLGEVIAHRVALDSLQTSLSLFRELFPEAAVIEELTPQLPKSLNILNVSKLGLRADIPPGWHVTTDSLAAYAAAQLACKLVLLKSTSFGPITSWEQAARSGFVDAHFPEVVERFKLLVDAVDFRAILNQLTDSEVSA
jgi:5-(aminomethyl)-3-furanmethanol phosphate kinase